MIQIAGHGRAIAAGLVPFVQCRVAFKSMFSKCTVHLLCTMHVTLLWPTLALH